MFQIFFIAILSFFCSSSAIASTPQSGEEVLIFYHIPKTAGLSVAALLDQQFKPEEICPDIHYHILEPKSVHWLKRFKFFRGHFFINSNLKQLRQKKITFLRDPVERVLSEQRYFETYYKQSWFHIPHFLPEGQPIRTMSNHQCLFLSSLNRNDPDITPEMHFASAKENIMHDFFFVGTTERLDESIHALYLLMGWEPPEIIPWKNKTDRESQTISPQVLEEIRQRNLLDIQLYEIAKEVFNAKLRAIDRWQKKKKEAQERRRRNNH